MESWTPDNEDDERLPRPDTLTDTEGVHEQDKADLWWSGPDESVNESDGAGSEREKRNRAQDRLSERRLGVRRQDAKAALPAWSPGDAEISLRSAHTHEPEDLDMEEAGGRGHGTGVKWREDNGREAHHPRSMLENEDHRELGDRDEPFSHWRPHPRAQAPAVAHSTHADPGARVCAGADVSAGKNTAMEMQQYAQPQQSMRPLYGVLAIIALLLVAILGLTAVSARTACHDTRLV